jgi:uncharacterized C2H2 Zn-finger protein
MSQPASFDKPRDGETVLACPHRFEWKRKAFYIGHVQDGQPTGLGRYVRRRLSGIRHLDDQPNEGIWVRWIVLCAWCRFWRWVRRQDPIEGARREIVWGGK